MKNNKISAFTLVELIVVITILAVLATVAFISFQGYTSSSRDSVRLADLKNVEKQLNIHFTQKNTYPDPSSPVSIPTGWTQGELGKSVTNQIWVSQVKDPLTKNYYFYRISQNKRKYQLMWFLENSDSISFSPLRSTFAENDIPYSKGDKLGIVLNSDGKTLPTTIDLSTGTYNVIFSNKTEENLTNISWEDNFVELKAADKWVFDESLVWYWDMETMTADWKLADLSGNNNHGTIHDADNSGLATPVNGAMVFDGVDDYVDINDSDILDMQDEVTILSKIIFENREDTYNYSIVTKWDRRGSNKNYILWIKRHFWGELLEFSFGNDQDENPGGTWNWYPVRNLKNLNYSQPYFLWATYDNQDGKLYINGELEYSENKNQNMFLNDHPLRIWNRVALEPYDNLEQFKWIIDEIMIFNRVLSQWEIQDIYNQMQ